MNNQQLATDSFSTGALAAGWSAINGLSESTIAGSSPYYAEPGSTSGTYGQQWTGLAWPVDQAAEVIVKTLTNESGTVLTLNVRMQAGANSGYQAVITNGTAALYVVTAGTPVQLGSTVSSLGFATGDVWSFQAAGGLLTLYQNWKSVIYFMDVTYASGSPGFSQSSTVNVAHCQVSTWSGYNTIQQSGVWQKQGILFPPIAAELGGFVQGVQNPWVLYETGPIVLPDLGGPVYKMWFVSSQSGSANNLSYAESYTFLPGSWVRYSGNPILTAGVCVSVWKHAGTYYIFTQTGDSAIGLWTSADGLTSFTSHGSVLTLGAGGTWDADVVFFFSPIYFDGTTLYALYGGQGATGPPSTGLATAVSPFTSFTKYVSNPVVTNWWGATQPYIDGSGNYWWWADSLNKGRSGGAYDPSAGVRVSSTPPFTAWSAKQPSLQATQQYGGLNDLTGGVYPFLVFGVGSQTYMLSEEWQLDSSSGEGYQFELAIASIPPATIVANSEDATVQVASDAFTSGTGNLSGNWAVITGVTRLQIVAGDLVEATTTSTNCAQCYTGAVFSADQYSEITIATLSNSSQFAMPMVRTQASGLNAYIGVVFGGADAAVYIVKTIAGANTQVGPKATATVQPGDVWRLSAIGSNPVLLTLTQNGFQILQVQDYSNQYTSGYPGMDIYATVLADAQVSLWAGGNAGVVPSGGSYQSWIYGDQCGELWG